MWGAPGKIGLDKNGERSGQLNSERYVEGKRPVSPSHDTAPRTAQHTAENEIKERGGRSCRGRFCERE